MKPLAEGARRSVLFFLFVACAGGVLAAERGWFSSVRLDVVSPRHWFSTAAVNHSAHLPAPASIEIAPGAEMSMSQLLNGLLFSRPAKGWKLASLNSPKRQPGLAWLTQDSYHAAAGADSHFSLPSFSSASAIASYSEDISRDPDGGPPPPGLTGNWISNASGNWGTVTNWQGGVIPSGPNSKAHFDTLNITTSVTVTTTSRSVGELYVGDTDGTHSYDIAPSAGAILTFDNSGTLSILQQSSTSAGDTISVSLLLNNDLLVSNDSTINPLQISGNIASNGPSGLGQTLYLNSGVINVSGDITDGTNGGNLSLQIGGDVNLSGTNTYSGGTFVPGSLFVKGDNSGATGLVQVSGGGSLISGIGTVGGHVTIFGGTITGATTTEVGSLTLNQGLDVFASEGGGGTYLANLSGATSDLLSITGALQLGQSTTLDIQGSADGTTTYTLATFDSISGVFGDVLGLPAGYNLVYHDTDIQLVPIPEPSTWIGGGLALAAIGWMSRRRLRRQLKCGARNAKS